MGQQEINKKVGGLDLGIETEVRMKMDKGVSLKHSHVEDTQIQAVSVREAGWWSAFRGSGLGRGGIVERCLPWGPCFLPQPSILRPGSSPQAPFPHWLSALDFDIKTKTPSVLSELQTCAFKSPPMSYLTYLVQILSLI